MTAWYTLDITCVTCQGQGKTTVLGTLLAPISIQEKALDKFLAKYNNAVFICNDCSKQIDRHIMK